MPIRETLLNYINGEWRVSNAGDYLDVTNPASGYVLAHVPLSPSVEVDQAAQAAENAFSNWRRTPAPDRIQHLFKLKNLLEVHLDELSRTITMENGKTVKEASGEMRRAIENVEVACGIPSMMQGGMSEDIARGVDEYLIRQPVGVCAIIAPFNFPGMIPFWFLPYALACGNTVIVKPSERTPITMQKIFRLLEEAGFPKGVVNMVNGGPETVNAILDHPAIHAVSFVGSTPVAKHIYARSSANGKRVQAQGGAKNPVVILPDADMDLTSTIMADSAFGNAGQRCLAAAMAITVGEARQTFTEALSKKAISRLVGNGLDPKVETGPVISQKSKIRIEGLIEKGTQDGAKLVVDGRNALIQGFESGYFIRPTILQDVHPESEFAKTEVFGPVLGMMHVESVDDAIRLVNSGKH